MAAETRRQAVNQKTDFFFLTGIQIGGFRIGALRTACGKPDEIKAETRIERIGEHIQLLAEKPFNDRRLARRRTHFDCDAPNRAIGAEENGFEAARAFAVLFQNARQSGGQGFERRCGLPLP